MCPSYALSITLYDFTRRWEKVNTYSRLKDYSFSNTCKVVDVQSVPKPLKTIEITYC